MFFCLLTNVQNAQEQVEPILQPLYWEDVPYCISQILFALPVTQQTLC